MKKKTRKTKEKLLSLLLTVAMLFTMQGIPVLAETVMPETNDAQVTVDTIGAAPSNPVHHCTKKMMEQITQTGAMFILAAIRRQRLRVTI